MMTKLMLVICLGLVCTACGSHASTTGTAPASPKTRGFALKPPVVAPAFALRDQDGRLTGPAQLRGHWYVVAFLYTHCPDVCPVIASNLGVALGRLRGLRVLAISVDPKNDTPASVKTFLRAHNLPPRFRYVTGTRAQLAPVWARYHVAAIAGPRPIVSHTAFELLVDPQGRERVLYDAQVQASDIARDVAALS
ncbi:MAG TPA: SCO family protein [Gaiellaceae bacterium]|jgi:protein SCO1/2|nr:SCO family protein [Gaiellaceae bacterium]